MRTFYTRTLGVAHSFATPVVAFWFFLRDFILAIMPSWIPRAKIAMFIVAMPPVILDWYFAGLHIGIAVIMRMMIAGTKITLAEHFYGFRTRILKPEGKEPSWYRRVCLDGPLYASFHATLFIFYGTIIHNFITPLDVVGAAIELAILVSGALFTGPIWMKTIFDFLHEKEQQESSV